jgi:hypothetical protein
VNRRIRGNSIFFIPTSLSPEIKKNQVLFVELDEIIPSADKVSMDKIRVDDFG